MKKILLLLVMLSGMKSFSQDTIATARVKEYLGREAWVKGKIASIKEAGEDNLIYINVDKSFPDNVFTVVLNVKYAERLKLNLKTAKGKNILVKGKIQLEKNGGQVPQILNPTQIQIK